MKVVSTSAVPLQDVHMEGTKNCQVRWLLSRTDGAPNFAMRLFEIQPGGHTPLHNHPYEHEIFVLEGEGEVMEGENPRRIKSGDVVLVESDDIHQFRNTGSTTMKFLCLIPNSADNRPIAQRPECSNVAQ